MNLLNTVNTESGIGLTPIFKLTYLTQFSLSEARACASGAPNMRPHGTHRADCINDVFKQIQHLNKNHQKIGRG